MKWILSLLLVFVIAVAVFVGCSSGTKLQPVPPPDSGPVSAAPTTQPRSYSDREVAKTLNQAPSEATTGESGGATLQAPAKGEAMTLKPASNQPLLDPVRSNQSMRLEGEPSIRQEMTKNKVVTESSKFANPNIRNQLKLRDVSAEPKKAGEKEEIWVIQKETSNSDEAVAKDSEPGSGALVAKFVAEKKDVPIPLKHTDVKANIIGQIATVDVSQQYQNPFSEKIEAVYIFPLPANAAVNEFLMTIGERKIRGIIREKEEAKRIYEEAKQQGYVASLMTQQRPNVFTQAVANIEPGKSIDIDIKYFHTLTYSDGWYEFVFPMVVGPRFNPPGSTDGIGAKPNGGAAGVTGQATEVSYLKPGERSGHDISLSVNIDAGVSIEKIESVNHKIVEKDSDSRVQLVSLGSSDSIPNKDFVLRYKVAGDQMKSAMMVQRDEKGGGYFTLLLVPPASLEKLPRQPLEMVFTLDVSGSMSGQPIEQSRAAIKYALTHMDRNDTFQIIRFAGDSEAMSPRPLIANDENVRQGLKYIESMDAGGGTMMLEGIRQSLNFSADENRLRYVAFLTDGYIGNESEILREVHHSLGGSRIFSFGVGSSPNRYLLDSMAKMGAGVSAYLSLNDDADKIMAEYFSRISHPALANISVDFGSMKAGDIYPARVPDLLVGRPVILTGRFSGEVTKSIRLRGRVGGEVRDIVVPVSVDENVGTHRGISSVWARAKIADMEDQATWDPDSATMAEIQSVALEHGLMSAYTSFVAVDSANATAGDHGTSVNVPVPVPDGVRYETTVPETAKN